MEPTGRRVEMGGDATWVEATTSKSDFRSTCYASASSTRGIPLPHFPPAALTVRVSLTHNSRARSLCRCLTHPLYTLTVAPALAYPRLWHTSHNQYILLNTISLPPSLSSSRYFIVSLNKPYPSLKVRYKLSLRRGVNSLKCFAIEYS